MPKLEIIVESKCEEKKLLNAIIDAGIDIGHRCGGKAVCTTCRVEFIEGEPDLITKAEYERLKDKAMLGKYRLSCQIICKDDMKLKPIMTLQNVEAWTSTGPDVGEEITPEPEWLSKSELEEFA